MALKPQFFVTRHNGSMVPLIAMDELPVHVQIRGVPRSLSPFDIAGMTQVGAQESRHQYYVVEGINNSRPIIPDSPGPDESSKPTTKGPVRNVKDIATLFDSIHADPAWKIRGTSPRGSTPELPAGTSKPKATSDVPGALPKAYGIEEQPPRELAGTPLSSANISLLDDLEITDSSATVSTNTVATPSTTTDKSTLPPWKRTANVPAAAIPGNKVYCTYWVRHGECDYAQQGCVYKHEMPLDLSTLELVGHRDIPRWYREKHGLASLLVNEGRNAPSVGLQDKRNWRVGEDAKRIIASQSRRPPQHPRNNSRLAVRDNSPGNKVPTAEQERVKDQGQQAREAAAARTNEALEREHKARQELALEKERKAMQEKYKVLSPERRSAFHSQDEIGDDLASDTFSNGEVAEETSIEEEISNAERTTRLIQLQKSSGRRARGTGRKAGQGRRRRS